MSDQESATSHNSSIVENTKPAAAWVRFIGLLLAGIAAACLSYFILSSVGKVYPTPPELMQLGAAPTPEERATAMAAKLKADSGNGMIWLGTAGAVLGGLLILASGLLMRSGRNTVTACLAAIVLTGLLGCAAGHWIVSFHDSIVTGLIGDRNVADTKFMLMHAAGWSAVGIGIGVAFGFLAPVSKLKICGRTAILGAVVGGLAGAAFPVIVGIAAPLVDATLPIPAVGPALAVWLAVPSIFMAVLLSRASCVD